MTASIKSAVAEVLARNRRHVWTRCYNNGAYAIPGAVEDVPTDALRAIFRGQCLFGWHDLTKPGDPS